MPRKKNRRKEIQAKKRLKNKRAKPAKKKAMIVPTPTSGATLAMMLACMEALKAKDRTYD